jgi:hypothetical protein
MVSSTVLTLAVMPALYALSKGWRRPHRARRRAAELVPPCRRLLWVLRTSPAFGKA